MLISDGYRALNAQQHADKPEWGRQAIQNWEQVKKIADRVGVKKILDYGCGKQMLKAVLGEIGYEVTGYDPAIPELSAPAEPHDFVVCLDVLEHVEPECLADVLADLKRVTLQGLLVVVATRPASKNLPDGTNPHRIIEPMSWWLERFREYFVVGKTNEKPGRVFAAILVPKKQ